MKQADYIRISEFFRQYSWGEKFVIWMNRIITYVIYVAFIATMGYLTGTRNGEVVRILLTTGISFVAVSIFRKLCNSKRPYEVYDFVPIIKKDKKGESMPSRHVFSAFVIAVTFFYLNPWVGIVTFVLAILMALGRIIGGVHFPKDVIVGAIIGIVSGVIGFYMI